MGKLLMCDLAGSEKIGKAGSVTPSVLSEVKTINSSLSALRKVI